MGSTGDGRRARAVGREKAAAGGLLQSWGWNWGIEFGGTEGQVKICH